MGAKIRWVEARNAWFIYVYANGTEKAKRLGATQADKRRGERLAKEVNRKQARGQLGLEKPKGKRVPFDEFAQRWLRIKVQLPFERGEKQHLSAKSVASHEQQVRLHLIPFLRSRDVLGFNVSVVEALWEHWIETGRPPSKRSREVALGTLRQILADAVRKGIFGSNPVRQWKDDQPKSRRSTRPQSVDSANVLGSEERECLLRTAERVAPAYLPFVLFLAETGCRVGEAIALRWSDVDLEAGVATVYREKTGTRGDVALSQRLRCVLRDALPNIAPPDQPAFTTPAGTPILYYNFRRRTWAPIVREAFGPSRRFTIHGLRHTWTTLHLSAGTPIKWIQAQGGWSSAKLLLDTYGHFLPREMRGFEEALAFRNQNRPEQAIVGRS